MITLTVCAILERFVTYSHKVNTHDFHDHARYRDH